MSCNQTLVALLTMLPRAYPDQNCSIARTLEMLGDRWTALIVRDSLFASRRFDDYLKRLQIARNVLSDRLARLTEEGILERIPHTDGRIGHEYQITTNGQDLLPVLAAMIEWGDRYHAPYGPPRELIHKDCGGPIVHQLTCGKCRATITANDAFSRPGPGAHQPASSAR